MSSNGRHADAHGDGRRIDLRPFTSDDAAFDRRVVASTMVAEIAMLDWTDRATESFIGMQYQARMDAHRRTHSGFEHRIITVDGAAVGRLLVHRSASETAVLDIALLPDDRGNGVGGSVLQRVIDSSGAIPVTIEVELSNPAQRLLRRLGFVECEVRGLYRRLRTIPASTQSATPAGTTPDT